MKMHKNLIVFFSLFLILTLSFIPSLFAKEPIVIRLCQENARTHPVGEGINAFAERVKELSNGEIVVQTYHAAELGSARATLEAVQFGNLEMATATSSEVANFAPELDIFNLPFLFRDIDHLMKVIDSEIGDDIRSGLEKSGFLLLGFSSGGARQLYTKRPINSPLDVKGMKIRVMEVPTIIETWKALGAIPVPISFSEVYTALQTGVCDGAESSFLSWISSHHYEVAPYGNRINYMDTGRVFVINSNFYNKLPKRLQKVLSQAMTETVDEVINPLYIEGDNNAAKTAEENNAQVLNPDLAPFQEAMDVVYDKFTPYLGKEAIEIIRLLDK